MLTLQEIADQLEARRQELQVTYDSLSASVGLTPLATRRALQGTTSPRITTVMALADKLGLEVMLLPKQVASGLQARDTTAYRPLSRVEQLTHYVAELPRQYLPAEAVNPARTSRRVSSKGRKP